MTPTNVKLLEQYNKLCDVITTSPKRIEEAKAALQAYAPTMIAAGGHHETWNQMLVARLEHIASQITREEQQENFLRKLRDLAKSNTDTFIQQMRSACGSCPNGTSQHDAYQLVWQQYNAQKARDAELARIKNQTAYERRVELEARKRLMLEKQQTQRELEELWFEKAVQEKMSAMREK